MNTNAQGVLIVASRREDRRTLFDALDGQGFGRIMSARDPEHARVLLSQGERPSLAVLDFRSSAAETAAFSAELSGVPVIGLVGGQRQGEDGDGWDLRQLPPGVVEWLRSPVDPGEARARAKAVFTQVNPPPATDAGDDDYRFVFEGSADELVISDPRDGIILEVNPAFEHASGMSAGQARGGTFERLFAMEPEKHGVWRQQIEHDGHARLLCEKLRADGTRYPVEVLTRLVVRGEGLVHFSTIRDATAAQDGRAVLAGLAKIGAHDGGDGALALRVQQFADAMQLDFVGVATPRGGEQTGLLEMLARTDRLPPPREMPDPLGQPAVQLALGGEAVISLGEAQKLAENDAYLRAFEFACYAALPLRDGHSNVLGVLLCAARKPPPFDPHLTRHALEIGAQQFAATLELREAHAQGRATGLLDALTGLPNRLLFNDRLETVLQEAHRSGEMFAMLFVDLDRFKNINDSLGHGVGDQVLIAVARRLRAAVRGSDTVARYAGDEFTLILRHIVLRDDVLRIAEKLVRAMEAPLTLEDDSELHITASIGISFYPDDAAEAEQLVKHADVAMYNAKGMGRNNYQAYVAVPEEQHQQRIELESKLRLAERNEQLRVYYQPQIATDGEDIVGMEALVRWEHPELGMISPAFFIPIAEESGLIIPIGEWVLRRACVDCVRWQKQYKLPLRVGVNLSALQLMQPNLVDVVRAACSESGLNPKLLDLEVTESISMKSVPNLLETLSALHGLGCGISIDDFGTGQSSLDYIKRFPADRIKIDQSFVRNIGMDPGDEAIVRATLEMAHSLGRKVVAEGVETEQHHAFLRELGCDELQGYLFCRPLSPVSFDNMLAERARAFAAGADPTNLLAELEALT
ncbi:MAG TPA: bifunctional diguanylate cyclase/phosphodiesterase [Rhodanobacteraceae bacterium]|nr:bifunctional diguanylate cyclase/phosphodiesterase [Rhodanobacteraceae bacterium]